MLWPLLKSHFYGPQHIGIKICFSPINLFFVNYIICQAPKNSPFLTILFENIKKTYPSNGHPSTNLQVKNS